MNRIYHFSAPGRTEICGNHTDHQHGCVLAAAVNLEITADVIQNNRDVICVCSEGYEPVSVDLSDLSVRHAEQNTTAALVRGVAAAFVKRGAKLQGFVPMDLLDHFRSGMEGVFGSGCCQVLSIRQEGGIQIE